MRVKARFAGGNPRREQTGYFIGLNAKHQALSWPGKKRPRVAAQARPLFALR
jgi:hypothetical protein